MGGGTGSVLFLDVDRISVACVVDGVRLPTIIYELGADLAGALPPSLGDLGPSLTFLELDDGAITSPSPSRLRSRTAMNLLSQERSLGTALAAAWRRLASCS